MDIIGSLDRIDLLQKVKTIQTYKKDVECIMGLKEKIIQDYVDAEKCKVIDHEIF